MTINNTRLFPTRLSISDDDREALGMHLNRTLASVMDLYTHVKQAHWNIKGPWFFARHELFDKLGGSLLTFADSIAERASALGNPTTGTAAQAAKNTVLEPYPEGVMNGKAHLSALADRYGKLVGFIRESAITAAKKDIVTEDLFIATLRQLELDLWFLESHLHD